MRYFDEIPLKARAALRTAIGSARDGNPMAPWSGTSGRHIATDALAIVDAAWRC
ncbi:hypothetical protein [Methylorubrum thiocyanatum]|uniref:hypothetical protein n=1 Tax=Methylorubrum thiocyanatum TaxID=47958 RepID=UPI00398C3BC1